MVQEKNKLIVAAWLGYRGCKISNLDLIDTSATCSEWIHGSAQDLKRLKKHYEQYEPTLTELRHKYEVAMKAS